MNTDKFEQLGQLSDPTWVNSLDLRKMLLSESVENDFWISAWAQQHDPLFSTLDKVLANGPRHVEIAGALAINGVVCVFTLDPSDGYRSYSGDVLVVPNAQLQTNFAPTPVHFVLSDSRTWDDPSDNSLSSPSLLTIVAVDTNEPLGEFGTRIGDSYYPSGIFYIDPTQLDAARQYALQRELHKQVEPGVSGRARKI